MEARPGSLPRHRRPFLPEEPLKLKFYPRLFNLQPLRPFWVQSDLRGAPFGLSAGGMLSSQPPGSSYRGQPRTVGEDRCWVLRVETLLQVEMKACLRHLTFAILMELVQSSRVSSSSQHRNLM